MSRPTERPRVTRRKFLGQSAVGLGLLTMARSRGAAGEVREGQSSIPPHRALRVPGIHAYASAESVRAGGEIGFHISASMAYRLSVVRLGTAVDDPGSDEVLADLGERPAGEQPIHPGSYVHVAKSLRDPFSGFAVECWVRLWSLRSEACLLSQMNRPEACGFALSVFPDGSVGFYLGDGRGFMADWQHRSAAGVLVAQRWAHVVGSWDGREKVLWVDGQPVGRWPWRGPGGPGPGTLRIGAWADRGEAAGFLDADLAMPVIYREGLGAADVVRRHGERGLQPAVGAGVLACWPLAEEVGARIGDISGRGRHGRLINHGTWMIGGPSFDANVPRFGNYDPAADPSRGHGLRLASDDLYDCRWAETLRYRVPSGARSGIHAARIEATVGGVKRLHHVTFLVTRAVRRRRAPMLVLCATNTWRAYSGTPFGDPGADLSVVWGTGGVKNPVAEAPAYCFYRGHAAGQGCFQIGLRMPWPVASPYVLYGGRTRYSHLCRADRFLHAWLEREGYAFDVVGDLDLHRDPELLDGYRVFVINGHSEYWSLSMWRGLERFLARRGDVVCLSGNSLFWRVSYDPAGTVLECRKVDAPGEQLPHERRGECWHSYEGGRGGLLRECGYPGWRLVGMETLGWNNQEDAEQFGAYVVDEAGHFLFHQPEEVGLASGDRFGEAPGGGLPRANGHEIDVRLSTLSALQQVPTPAGAHMPTDPPGMTRLANGAIAWKRGGAAFDYFFRPIKPAQDQGGELIYWERPEGGRVVHAGSIGAGWALHADPRFQRLMRNVLHHFRVPGRRGGRR